MTDGATRQLIGIAIPTLKHLRLTTLGCISAGDSGDADAVDALREAGFAGGPAVYAAFEQWLNENEAGSPANVFASSRALRICSGSGRAGRPSLMIRSTPTLAFENCTSN